MIALSHLIFNPDFNNANFDTEVQISKGCAKVASPFGGNQAERRLGTQFGIGVLSLIHDKTFRKY